MKIFKGIIHVLAWICYVAIAVYAIICIPIIFGHKPLVVLSDSMEPNIKEGSIIYYRKVPKKDIKEGNIISFKVSDKIVSHRVYKVDEKGFTTKGDATSTIDPVVITYDKVLGKVDNIVIPYMGYYVKTINNNYYIVVIVVIILIMEFALSNFKRKENEEPVEEVTDETSGEPTPEPELIATETPAQPAPVTPETPVVPETPIEPETPVVAEEPVMQPIVEENKYKTEVFDLEEIKEAQAKVETPVPKEEDEEIEIL